MSSQRLASDEMVINSPMSFAGAAQRAFRMKRHMVGANPKWYEQIPAVLGVLLVIAAWWALVAVWYVVFGLLLVPYRLLRRGARKRTKEALQHRQMPAAIEATDRTTLEASAATPASEPPVAQRELAPVTVDVGLAAATASEDAAVPLPDDTPPALARLH